MPSELLKVPLNLYYHPYDHLLNLRVTILKFQVKFTLAVVYLFSCTVLAKSNTSTIVSDYFK